MEDHPVTLRVYPGDLCPVYYTSVIVFHTTEVLEVIRLSLERLQIYEDKTLYELYSGHANSKKNQWTKIEAGECPVALQQKWKREMGGGGGGGEEEEMSEEMRFFLHRKEHASLVLAEIVSQYISPEVNEGRVQDMCDLEEFTEQDMLSNLRARFSNKDIYTYVGSILIAINPYYFYSIYNPKYTSMYQGKALGSLPPHIFAMADSAYHMMLNERQNQSVIISGESGAGKTESTKFLLHHLMSLSAKLDESQSLELITLGTGPVLEAFGNARTVANNNSSRFGKFILVQFKENGAYHGASIEKYLLEKSRIISQAPGERNYHVFYYLLVGADQELKKKLKLGNIDDYNYLTQGSSLGMDNGAEEYHRLRQSLGMLRFGTAVQMGMFTVLSAILQLGNIVIEKVDGEELEVAVIKDLEPVEVIASLLQVDERTLRSALTTRTSKAGGTDSFVTPYRVDQALAARDSMAKALYGALFDWIVDKVNVTLATAGKDVVHKGNAIGVLDIFGFEVFKKNSFEQFCINYANEQLQQYFNKHIFKVEQAEYIAEGIEWSSVSFVDNQECLDLIAKKPTGLLPLLDEECSFPGADDNSLFQKFERQHKSNPCYYSPALKQSDPQFSISHYASDVSYSIKGFREKNRDLMRQDIVDVLKTSHMDLVRALIGQPPFALHCWRMAHLKLKAVFLFRKAGRVYKQKKESPSFQFKLRIASSPQLESPTHTPSHGHPPRAKNLSDDITLVVGVEHDNVDAFPILYGQKRAGFGMRPSRSYDMLTNMGVEADKEAMLLSSSMDCRSCMPYGASPMTSRRKHVSQKFTPPPVISKSSTLPLNSTPQYSKSPKKSEASPPRSRRRHSFTKKKEDSTSKNLKKEKEKEEPGGRSRLSSLSRMQEKLRKRLSRNFKNKELVPEQARERPSDKYWSPSPRIKILDGTSLVDGRLCPLARTSSMRHGPPKTISGQFQASLLSLVDRLEVTNPYFIRCLKSNGEKAPCKFDSDLVMRQLRYTGMMETIKIRKAGYPVRMDFEAFYEKYQFLIGPQSSNLAEQIKEFLQSMGFSSEDIQIGITKVFMREKQKRCLQEELGDKVLARIVKIQRWVRAKMLRCRFLHLRRNSITIQCAVRCWLAKEKANILRKRVCAAVLIQSAWRGALARKRLFFLHQAAAILQTYWRGRAARLAYKILVDDHRRRLREEEQRKLEEERLRQEEEERRRIEEETAWLREEEQRKLEEERSRQEEEERRRIEEETAWLREEEQRKLEEERSRQEEEERRRIDETALLRKIKEEELTAEEGSRRETEEESREVEEDLTRLTLVEDGLEKRAHLLQTPDPAALRTSSALSTGSTGLDPDVRDALFQFDSIVTALEEETLKDSTPSPIPFGLRPLGTPRATSPLVSSAPHPPTSTALPPTSSTYTATHTSLSRENSNDSCSKRISNGIHLESFHSVPEGTHSFSVTPPPRLSRTPPPNPPDQEELIRLKNVAKVKSLKQQFLSQGLSQAPLELLLSRQNDIEDMQKTQSTKVKSIVAQMSVPILVPEHEDRDRTSPPISPHEKDLEEVRKYVAIADKITHLHLSVDEKTEKKYSSYKPSTLRRKVVSPFLDQEVCSEDAASSSSPSPESSKRMKMGEKERDERCEKVELPTDEDASQDGVPLQSNSAPCSTSRGEKEALESNVMGSKEVGSPLAEKVKMEDLAGILEDIELRGNVSSEDPIRDCSKKEGEGEGEGEGDEKPEVVAAAAAAEGVLVNGLCKHHGEVKDLERQLVSAEQDKPVTPGHMKEEHDMPGATPPVPPSSSIENTQAPNAVVASQSQKTPADSRPPAHSSSPYDCKSLDRALREREKSLDSTAWTYDRRQSATPLKNKEDEDIYTGPSYIVEGEKDEDHLVSIVFKSTSSKKKKREHQYSSGSMYTPSGSIYNSGRGRMASRPDPTPPPLPPPRKSSSTVSVDDVFVSFKMSDEESRTTGSRRIHRVGSDGKPSSSRIADVLAGVRENGVPSSYPQLTDIDQDRMNASYSYDRLSDRKGSEYDHLMPLGHGIEFKSLHGSRPRTSSDVSSHHRMRSRKDRSDLTTSEVVPREYQSTEHHHNSLRHRKRSALSLADPVEMLKTRGIHSLEESSELTRCLTPEEIVNLNQGRPSGSPSDRARLFSFTKNLRNPFSKSRGKREKDTRDRLISPDKEQQVQWHGLQEAQQQAHQRHHHQGRGTPPTRHHHKHGSPVPGWSSHGSERTEGSRRGSSKNMAVSLALAHNFRLTTMSRFSVYTCATCNKGFTGFMKQGLKCLDCNIVVHRHCEDRSPACKAHIESGAYVTMSRKKIIQKAEDLDDLGRFLLEKIAVLARDSSQNSVVDKVFKQSLKEFHTFLISTYSLSLQSSVESTEKEGVSGSTPEEPRINLTLSQLVCNFDNIFRGIAKREGLNDPCHIAIGVNQIRTFLDEFGKARRIRKYSSNINPSSLRRKTPSGSDIQPKLHKGHKFVPQQFQVPTVCEQCSKAVPFLGRGDVCQVCGYTCHEGCLKKVHKKCEGKGRVKQGIPEYQPNPKVDSKQFGIPIENLVLPNCSAKIPPILETCFKHIEANGLYTQGVYRKSAGVSSKRAVRAALEDHPEIANLESYSVHAVAAAVGGFFRELPEPLLTRDMYMEFLRAMDLTDKKERQRTLHKLISHLPEVNHAVFERLIFHLARIAQHEHINRMGPGNLAIIFAPCLLQGSTCRNPEEMLRDIQKQTDCLEAIITEQVEKLTATIRGIRTLDSFARETETKLSQLINQFESSESGDSTPSSTLKETPPTFSVPPVERKGMTDEERTRLTCTLEEIERERAELTVNLPKLEPYLSGGEEEDHGSLDSDHLTTPSPSPSPLTVSSLSRSQRTFSPISESGLESPLPPRRHTGSATSTSSRSGHEDSMKIPPHTPSISVARQDDDCLPAAPPSFSPLTCLTKNRVSRRPHIRPPSTSRRRQDAAAATTTTAAAPLSVVASDAARFALNTSAYTQLRPFSASPECSPAESEDELLFETTV